MERTREIRLRQPQPPARRVKGQRLGAKPGEPRRIVGEDLDPRFRPQRPQPLNGDLEHCYVAEVQQVVSVRLDNDPRVVGHGSGLTPRSRAAYRESCLDAEVRQR